MLQEDVKTRVRVHLGVPVLGVQNSGFALGYRFTNQMGLLEYRMLNLQPFEEASITGVPAALALIGPGSPQAGDTLTLTLNALTPVTYTVASSDVLSADPLSSIAANVVRLIQSTSAYAALVVATYVPAKTQPYPNAVAPNAGLILQALTATAFTITCSFTGQTPFAAYTQGTFPNPKATFTEDGETLYGYVPICDYLEGKIASASDLLKYSTADVVTFRPDEMRARKGLYDLWRKRLADFLGVPLYPVPAVGRYGGAGTGLVV